LRETGLFYQCVPLNKKFTFWGKSASRAAKESKLRLTLILGANMDGSDKIQPLVIGKEAQPRCFRGSFKGRGPRFDSQRRPSLFTHFHFSLKPCESLV